jgi:cytochrome d ubiquinol oxidase subunit I
MTRLAHVLVGAFILGAFFVMSISAWYLLRGKHEEFGRRSFAVALWVAAVFSVLALLTGDQHGRIVARYQPAKLAAMEGVFAPSAPADLHLFGIPDAAHDRVDAGVAIPGGLSLLLYGDPHRPVRGLESFPPEDRPPLATFYAFHLMVAIGSAFLVLTLGSLPLLRRGALFRQRWLLWIYVFAVLGAYAANQVGWCTAELGRQPWVVYGLLRTHDGVSPSARSGQVLASILMFGAVYALLFAVWVYVMNDKVQHGPDPVAAPETTTGRALVEVAALRDRKGAALLDEAGN